MRIFLLYISMMVFSCTVAAQSPEQILQHVKNDYERELIFIHYDKTSYVAGETIWFKAYISEGFAAAKKSTVLSVSLADDSGHIVESKIYPIAMGMACAGNFELPLTVRSGNYTVKAFTARMMNFGNQNFYYHSISVTNPNVPPVTVPVNLSYNIHFLPESGNAVANIPTTIAFKCIDENGLPAVVSGTVSDSRGKIITSFKSIHDGMGSLEITPIQNEKYTALVTLPDGSKKSVELPEVLSQGTVLNIKEEAGKTYFQVDYVSGNTAALTPAYVLGVVENMVVFKTMVSEAAKNMKNFLPVDSLPSGIFQLTAFNADNQPLAERLLFINSGDYQIDGIFQADTLSNKKREKNVFSFEVSDTLTGSYSVAVTAADETVAAEKDNIYSGLLLTGIMKGPIFNPAYYFEKNDAEHRRNLDLVMMTNGWRRYSWNELLLNKFPSMSFKDPNFIKMEGTVYDARTNMPDKNAQLFAFVNTADSSTDYLDIPVNDSGQFKVEGLIFNDSARFVFKNLTTTGRTLIQLKPYSLSSQFRAANAPAARFAFLPLSQNDLQKRKEALDAYLADKNTLERITVKARNKSKNDLMNKKYVSGVMGGYANSTLDLVNDPPRNPGINVLDYLRNKLTGVTFGQAPDYELNYRQNRSLSGGSIPMNVFLDESQIDVRTLSTITIDQIALVKVYSSGNLAGAGGALAVYTRKMGDMMPNSANTLVSVAEIKGFSPVKEFYSPNYNDHNMTAPTNDYRTTLYWDPYLTTTPANRKIKFSYYNSDKVNPVKIILQGLSVDGHLLYFEKIVNPSNP